MKMRKMIQQQRDKPVESGRTTARREMVESSIRALSGEGNERKFILSFSSEDRKSVV